MPHFPHPGSTRRGPLFFSFIWERGLVGGTREALLSLWAACFSFSVVVGLLNHPKIGAQWGTLFTQIKKYRDETMLPEIENSCEVCC